MTATRIVSLELRSSTPSTCSQENWLFLARAHALAPQPALKRASALDAVADIELDVSKPSKDVAPVLEDTESAMKAVDESRKKLRATLESLAATRKNLARATDGTTEVVAKFESMQEQLKASLARLASRLADRGQAAEVPPERAARARALGARASTTPSRARRPSGCQRS